MASMFAAPGAQARLTIPLLESSDVVVIPVSSLPEEVEELLEILAAEAAPLTTWFDFAKAYLATGKDEAFRHICEEGVKDEVTEEVIRFFGAKPVYEQTQFHCGLAALHMARGREEGDKARKAECFALAAKHIQAAKLMIPEEQMVTITEGLLHLAKVRRLGHEERQGEQTSQSTAHTRAMGYGHKRTHAYTYTHRACAALKMRSKGSHSSLKDDRLCVCLCVCVCDSPLPVCVRVCRTRSSSLSSRSPRRAPNRTTAGSMSWLC